MRNPGCWRRRLRNQDGNGLMLMPAAVLIVLGLGGLAVDTAAAFRAHRALDDLATSLANDIAGAAIDAAAYYDEQTFRLDPDEVDAVLTHRMSIRADDPLGPHCTATIPDANTARVRVTCTGTTNALLGIIHGGRRQVDLEAAAEAALTDA